MRVYRYIGVVEWEEMAPRLNDWIRGEAGPWEEKFYERSDKDTDK